MNPDHRVGSRNRSPFGQQHTDTRFVGKSALSERIHPIGQLSFHHKVISFGPDPIMFRAVLPDSKSEPLVHIRSQMYNPHIVRKGSKHFAGITYSPFLEDRRCHSLFQIQRPAVTFHPGILLRKGVIQLQIAQQLVTAVREVRPLPMSAAGTFADKGIIHPLLRLIVTSLEQQAADIGQTVIGIGIIGILPASRPHGDIIQHNILVGYTTIRHHTDTAVAQRERSLPLSGRLIEEIGHPARRLYLRHRTGQQP